VFVILFVIVSGKNRATNEISVKAQCYRSMRKAEAPHQLRVGLVF